MLTTKIVRTIQVNLVHESEKKKQKLVTRSAIAIVDFVTNAFVKITSRHSIYLVRILDVNCVVDNKIVEMKVSQSIVLHVCIKMHLKFRSSPVGRLRRNLL